jgi:hypothetical protein
MRIVSVSPVGATWTGETHDAAEKLPNQDDLNQREKVALRDLMPVGFPGPDRTREPVQARSGLFSAAIPAAIAG